MINIIKRFLGLDFYVSPLDKFLQNVDKQHPKHSLSQRKEIEKYDLIFALRDGSKLPASSNDSLWESF